MHSPQFGPVASRSMATAMSAYLLAVDPGVTTGCCLFEDGAPVLCFTLRTVTWKTVVPLLLQTLYLLWGIKFDTDTPADMVIEDSDPWTRNGVNVAAMKSIWGIVYVLAFSWTYVGIGSAHVVPVSEWKGSRSKRSTSAEAALILKAEGVDTALAKNEHERDALALGLWWLRHGKERELRCSS